jgi:hypothetical protein
MLMLNGGKGKFAGSTAISFEKKIETKIQTCYMIIFTYVNYQDRIEHSEIL